MYEDLKYLSNIKRTVLVVDDEEINREILGGILEDNYNVLFAEDGDQALSIMNEQGPLISLVLLDLMMPVMDGFDVMEKMHEDMILRTIPIIVLTSDESAEVESLQQGAADFIKKPYDMPEKILARVRRIIALYENQMLIRSTERDDITGLLAKSYFFEYASFQDKFNPGRKMDAISINVNHYHLYNELYGMRAGEKALQGIAGALIKYADEKGGIACRCDGDNFNLYVPRQDSYDELVKKVHEAIDDDPEIYDLRIRVGVNQEPCKEDERLEMAFDRARMAGATIEEKPGESIAYYDSEMRKKRVFEEKLIMDIANAIILNQINVLYQPRFDISGDKPVLKGAEAQAIWDHPEYGTIYPESFIPIFEENGMIQVLDEFLWQEAAAQISKWKEEFGVTIPVSVNVSRTDIQHEGILESICEFADNAGIAHKDFHLEITEAACSAEADQVIAMIERFRSKGFIVEIDGFGSGNISLSLLSSIPVDILKADLSSMRKQCSGDNELRSLGLMVDIAKYLKVPVVAGGILKQAEQDALKAMGCDLVQGEFLSGPVFEQEFARFIEKK